MAKEAVGLVLCDDLIFSSRILTTAQSLGLTMKTARSAPALAALAVEQPSCVVVDLANPGLNITEMVQQLRSQATPPFIVAYGSHVDTAKLQAARDAGCDVVLPRSKFVEVLPVDLVRWFGQEKHAGGEA